MKKSTIPRHLSSEARLLWREISDAFELNAEHVRTLRVACEQFDLAQSARRQVAKDGMLLDGKRHPLIGVQQKATELYLRAVRDLGLQGDDDGAPN